jgi:hypothetical protein
VAGYSGTPLPRKLGIKPGLTVALLEAPPGFEATLGTATKDARMARTLGVTADVIVLFVKEQRDLASRFDACARRLMPTGGLWIAWPKKSSGVKTDLNENIIRDFGLRAGLVDNKVCAIDDIWSGLRFVIRLKDRTRV